MYYNTSKFCVYHQTLFTVVRQFSSISIFYWKNMNGDCEYDMCTYHEWHKWAQPKIIRFVYIYICSLKYEIYMANRWFCFESLISHIYTSHNCVQTAAITYSLQSTFTLFQNSRIVYFVVRFHCLCNMHKWIFSFTMKRHCANKHWIVPNNNNNNSNTFSRQ